MSFTHLQTSQLKRRPGNITSISSSKSTYNVTNYSHNPTFFKQIVKDAFKRHEELHGSVQGTFLIRIFIDSDQLDTPININKYFQHLSEFNFGHLDEALTRVAQSKRFLEEGHFNVFIYIIKKA
jgi:hypothetical protein